MLSVRTGIIALLSLWVVILGPIGPASAAPVSFGTVQTDLCDSLRTPCRDFGFHDGTSSFITGSLPVSASNSHGFIIPEFRNLGANASITLGGGFLSAYAAVQGTANGAFITANGVSASATGTLQDFLTISSGAFLAIPFHLTGSVNLSYSVGGSTVFPPATVFTAVSLHLGVFAGTDAALAANLSQDFNFTSSEAVDTVLNWVIPFTPGTQFYFAIQPTLFASMGHPGTHSFSEISVLSGRAIGDFSHTGVFGGATVLDASGNVLPNVNIESALGFDYRAGFSAVPTPGAFYLLGTALAGLVGMRRRRSA